jgi:O-acetyl-ADP-ribose deacetylase (regulator of RNase III)
MDVSSLWVELIPCKDTSADTTVTAIFDNIIARYGLPKEISILSDNAAAFTSRLTAAFCKTFGIKQLFSSPQHSTINHRVDKFDDTLNKTLRALCEKQSDWSRHLQSVAMSYRSTETTATGLSPYHILFGRPFPLIIDRALMIDELVGTPEAYAADIRPKLEVLRQVAMTNATESAAHHAQKYNSIATPPPFKVNDKVLLYTPVTKKNESAKLTRRFVGPYVITHCLSGFHYRLKHLESGKQLRRPVHAGRLRPFREPDDERVRHYRDPDFSGTTQHRRLDINTRVGDITRLACDAIVNPANAQLRHEGGAAHCIARAAGEDFEAECRAYITQHGPLAIAKPIITTAGRLKPRIQQIIHVVGPCIYESPFHDDPLRADASLEECYYNCLQLADSSGLQSIAFPAISAGNYGMDKWSVAHAAAKALSRFDMESHRSPGTIRRIEFINSSLVMSGIMNIVFKGLFSQPIIPTTTHDPSPDPPISTDNNEQSQADTSWFEIDRIIRSCRRKGKTLYLVQWRNSPDTSWVERKDLTDVAFNSFTATRRRRKRRCT